MSTPDLASYDVVIVNSSAGKDSQAMLDVLAEQATEEGAFDRLVVVHCDLGRLEWPDTRELAERQANHYDLPFAVVRNSNWTDLLERVESHGKWPDAARRFCTSEFKTGPVVKLMTAVVDTLRTSAGWDGRKVRILNCLGLRADESPARAKKPVFGPDPANWTRVKMPDGTYEKRPHGKRQVDRWLPIHAWPEEAVWGRIRASGVESHPAYAMGMPRLSCSFCVLASKSALIRAAQLRPELAAEYAGVESRINHRFRDDLTMADIIAAAQRSAEPAAIDGWAA